MSTEEVMPQKVLRHLAEVNGVDIHHDWLTGKYTWSVVPNGTGYFGKDCKVAIMGIFKTKRSAEEWIAARKYRLKAICTRTMPY